MATVSMERAIQNRKIVRCRFTICRKKLEKCIEQQDSEGMKSEFSKLEKIHEDLVVVQNSILSLWLDSEEKSDEIIEADLETVDNYDSDYFALQLKVAALVKNSHQNCDDKEDSLSAVSSTKQRLLRLPKLQLPKFDGTVKNWLQFWTQFVKIHNDSNIDNDDKFQYLLQSVELGSSARELVESFPPSAANYPKVIDQLKQRYAKDEVIIQHYVRELLKLIASQGKPDYKMSTRSLYDKLMTQILSLESLGVTKDKFEAFLYPMVESALPEDILRAWNRSHLNTYSDEKGNTQLEKILNFLRNEVESEERITMARGYARGHSKIDSDPTTPTATFLTAAESQKDNGHANVFNKNECVWCEKSSHNSSECKLPIRWTIDQKKEFLTKKKACLVCLRIGHFAKKCRKFPKCLICQKRHYPIMCFELNKVSEKVESETKAMLKHTSSNGTVLLQTVKFNIVQEEKVVRVRALLDSGAQRSFVKTDVVNMLKAKPTGQEQLQHNLFGGVVTRLETHNLYALNCISLDGKFSFILEALENKIICDDLPKVRQSKLLSKLHTKGIKFSDCVDDETVISILIGCDILGSLYTGRSEHVSQNLVAVETKLGWVIQGPAFGMYCTFSNDYNFTQACSFDVDDLWALETLGIKDEAEVKSAKRYQEEVDAFFRETIRSNLDSRYEVRLPWKDTSSVLTTNYDLARKRLMSTTIKLTKLNLLKEYDDVFNEWVDCGIIEEVVNDDAQIGHYLPHHAVVKESSLTTKIRPVFDASALTKDNVSLNACLEKGSNLIELIPRLIVQFRKHAIGITADIKKAFLQISVHPEDREFLKFLWWNDINSKTIKVFRHCRVVFGVTTSPYLLSATILHHLENYTGETADKLKKCFYVDNCVISVTDEDSMNKFIKEAKAIMIEGQFELRCWVTGPVLTDGAKEPISVLGVLWDPQEDELYCKVPFLKTVGLKLSKRSLLSMAQSVFDPIGYVSPTTLIPKILIQKCWQKSIDWDQELPDDIAKTIKDWLGQAGALEKCRIPRRVSSTDLAVSHNTLHVFSDASQKSYAGCVFLRSEFGDKVQVRLIASKSRVAPVKPITVPRLELIAALMATRLAADVKEALGINCKLFYWTDSNIVLAWIRRRTGLNVFVQNRVREILDRTGEDIWNHVPGDLNPADLPSRGCYGEALLKSQWWYGPKWLLQVQSMWPNIKGIPDEREVNREIKSSCFTIQEAYKFTEKLLYFSKYSNIVRTVAWCMRFIYICRNKSKPASEITGEEYAEAEKRLLLIIQHEEFDDVKEISKKLNMNIFKGADGLLRVKTRLTLSRDSAGFITPILLPDMKASEIIHRLIRQRHVLDHHAGSQTLISNLREDYWIIGIRRAAKKVVRDCIACRRHSAKPCTVPAAPLPRDRVICGTPFEVTGVDLAGPILLKCGTKAWIVIFTCATYRAIHLELCTSLSTEEFLLTLRRFVSRRGRPRLIYSDNGTNFHGAYNLMKEIDWDEVSAKSSVRNISWRFIPPLAPWWGGWWERMVRMVKEILRRVLGKAALYEREFLTVLCEAEALINSRPLTYIADGTEHVKGLTPSMFLQVGCACTADLASLDAASLTVRYRYIKQLCDDLKQRFRSEYLSLLTQKCTKESVDVKIGDVVLVGSDNVKRVNWPLGLVLEIVAGTDNAGRVARVKTARGIRLRALQRLFPLEVAQATPKASTSNANEASAFEVSPCPYKTTRSGRLVKIPSRFEW